MLNIDIKFSHDSVDSVSWYFVICHCVQYLAHWAFLTLTATDPKPISAFLHWLLPVAFRTNFEIFFRLRRCPTLMLLAPQWNNSPWCLKGALYFFYFLFRPLSLWPDSVRAAGYRRMAQWWRWETCWRWWVRWGSGRPAPRSGRGSSYPHTPPSQGPTLGPTAGCLIAAAHTDLRTALWGIRTCY